MADTEILADGLFFTEGPRWHDNRFWFSDFYSRTVNSVSLDGDVRVELELDDQPSGLGWLPDGRMLVVAMLGRKVMRVDGDGTVSLHADLGDIATYHCNDMIVDDAGRAYVGNFGFDVDDFLEEHGIEGIFDEPRPLPASLTMVDLDGTARRVANGLSFPNGMVITPDGQTLIVAETTGSALTAFDRRADGTLTNRRTWANLLTDTAMLAPDGICLDANRGVWVADATGTGVHRVVEGGEITQVVTTSQPAFACMLGGPERRHLLACTAEAATTSIAAGSPTGRLEIVEVEVAGAGTP
ncbi:MAG: SMP-30/gluconolactonase/LRE family protein [Acidimicrobiia bacterium]|nr:SMP-30/gluconolactonase/LRE family protein [Acidimicrobiia bacterium]